ncbi:MAG: hypothetical protein PHH07_04575 [Candidatus Cloacimonetes bacterium]|nr:hypothetical protein [Candidatus Cloacimonadota bacterium]
MVYWEPKGKGKDADAKGQMDEQTAFGYEDKEKRRKGEKEKRLRTVADICRGGRCTAFFLFAKPCGLLVGREVDLQRGNNARRSGAAWKVNVPVNLAPKERRAGIAACPIIHVTGHLI